MLTALFAPSPEPRLLPTGRQLIVVVLGNTLIATLLWATGVCREFGSGWVTVQCIGLSIFLICVAVNYLTRSWRERLGWAPGLLVGVLVGMPLGIGLARLLGFEEAWREVRGGELMLLRYMVVGLLFSSAFFYYFRSRVRIMELDQARQAAELRQAQGQKSALQAELRLLQAQIEPHFLFNTLANLHSLIGRDDAAARGLLERLNDYLRASLAHSRAARCTLGQECAMLEAYLAIQAQRMGGRLRYALDVDTALRERDFPPMLLQPLVENAVVHGIEPKLGDGHIVIRAWREDGSLHLAVEDDGVGFGVTTAGGGVGLANVRERLSALYGEAGRLSLRERAEGGVCAELCLPDEVSA